MRPILVVAFLLTITALAPPAAANARILELSLEPREAPPEEPDAYYVRFNATEPTLDGSPDPTRDCSKGKPGGVQGVQGLVDGIQPRILTGHTSASGIVPACVYARVETASLGGMCLLGLCPALHPASPLTPAASHSTGGSYDTTNGNASASVGGSTVVTGNSGGSLTFDCNWCPPP